MIYLHRESLLMATILYISESNKSCGFSYDAPTAESSQCYIAKATHTISQSQWPPTLPEADAGFRENEKEI